MNSQYVFTLHHGIIECYFVSFCPQMSFLWLERIIKLNILQKTTTDTQMHLTGLKASTKYDVEVLSVSKEGASLPSPEVIFLTYYDGMSVLPFTTPSTPNLTPIPPHDIQRKSVLRLATPSTPNVTPIPPHDVQQFCHSAHPTSPLFYLMI